MEEDKGGALVKELIEMVSEISAITEYRCTVKKQYCNLARRLKLLTPMFEEIRDSKEKVPQDSFQALVSLKDAMQLAVELLRFGSEGSKIYMVLEREQIMNRLQEVTDLLEHALSGISYEKLDISDEIQEQVELVLAQFRRAKGRIDAPDVELYEDLSSLYNRTNDAVADPAVLRRLVDKLQLTGIADLTQESLALHDMVTTSGGDPGESIEKMSMLLKKIKDFVQIENPKIDSPSNENSISSNCSGQASANANKKAPVIPDDFRCPISLELMKDPVIVSTGQTYERSCIEKWLETGHDTCPKTQQTLTSFSLTPNYVLRSLIAQWCEANGVEPPKRPSRLSKTTSACSPAERSRIETLLHMLASGSPEDQYSAASEVRLLAKRNADNRVAIAEAGTIPLLVGLLSTPDSRTQEHVVTALLNLSICEDNKGSIVSSGAIPGIVNVLKKGSMEARENAAATLFSLSVVDVYKVTIGASGAIPPLVTLLSEGTQRGKKDAATALFNLCIYQGNKGKAVRAGVVPTLMGLLTEPQGAMVDEALAILAILSSHSEGKVAIGAAEAVPVLVDVIGSGPPTNKENAAAVLVHLSSGDQHHLVEAQKLGVMDSLVDLAQNGTKRGKRKAAQLLERIKRFAEQQKQAEDQAQAEAQPQPQPQAEAFVIAPQSRKMVLPSTARKRREFKSKLTNTYVYPFEDEELLCDPPEEYRELHKKQQEQEICAQYQYNHRLSRKGYVGLEDELLEKMAEDDIDRATLWRKDRDDKYGNIPYEKTAEKAKEIDEVTKKVFEDLLTVIGSHDILTMALGISEHVGRVRGVGGYVTPSSYFNQPGRQREYVKESIKETFKELLEERDKGQALAAKLVAEERDFWVQRIMQIEAKIDGKCTGPSETIPPGHLTPPTLNGAHVSDKASCSAIKNVDEPTDEKEDVYNGENKDNDNKKMPPLKKHEKCLKFDKTSNESHNLLPMPSSLKVLCGYAKHTLQLKGDTIKIVMEEEVFGFARTTHILYEDILQFGAMSEISGTCIVMYIRYLYDVLKKTNMLRRIIFVDPTRVSAEGCGSFSQKTRYIASQFSRAHPGTIFLIPYNSGGHWVLTIVNLDNNNVYFMDSLKYRRIDEEWKQVVNTSIEAYNRQSNNQRRQSPQWRILVGTPVQPTHKECGYFVMRFMKEIVEDGSLDFVAKWDKANRLTYTQEQIDEVRCEWATYVGSLCEHLM